MADARMTDARMADAGQAADRSGSGGALFNENAQNDALNAALNVALNAAQSQDGHARDARNDAQRIGAIHTPVLLAQCVELVTGGLAHGAMDGTGHTPVVVDCTLGLAGHSIAFMKAVPELHVIGIDRDGEALALATRRVQESGFADRFTPVHQAFDALDAVLEESGVDTVDAVFMDLGLSSLQIDETGRGFSYSRQAPLDMRMDTSQKLTAADVLNTYSADDLARIFREYGEERFAAPIARAVVRERQQRPLKTSDQLVDIVERTVPRAHRAAGNPAKRVFQALRIEVNGELDKLARTLPQAALHLAPGGRIVVESYHSLEDRTVKRFMSRGLVADVPSGLPVVPDEAQPYFRDLTHGAMKADQEEVAANPRSASVRLRAVELTRPIPQERRRQLEKAAMPVDPRADEARQRHRHAGH